MKAAAEETKRALAEVGQAAGTAGPGAVAPIATTQATTEALREQGVAATAAATATAELQEVASRQEIAAFARILGLFSREASVLVAIVSRLKDALAVLFTPVGLALTAVIVGFMAVKNYIESATEAARAFAEQQERIKRAGVEMAASVSEELGKLGKGSEEAFTKATAAAKRMEAAGFEAGAARATAAGLVTEEGRLAVPEEELPLYAAAVQRGEISFGGKTPREQERKRRQAERFVERNRERLQRSARAFMRPRQREEAGLEQPMDTAAMAAMLQRSEGLSPEEAEAAVRDIKEIEERGEPAVMSSFLDEQVLQQEGPVSGAWAFAMQAGEDINIGVEGLVGTRAAKVMWFDSARLARIRRAQKYRGVLEQVRNQGRAARGEQPPGVLPDMTPIEPGSLRSHVRSEEERGVWEDDPRTGRQAQSTSGRGAQGVVIQNFGAVHVNAPEARMQPRAMIQ